MSKLAAETARVVDLSNTSTLSGYEDIASAIGLRLLNTTVEEFPGGTSGRPVILRASATAVIRNPWTGTSTDEDLQPETIRIAPLLAKLLTDRLIDALGGAEAIEAFGKGSVVGLGGELEHAGALIHTPYFGNLVREALQGTSIICFADDRAAAGSSIRIPLWHKTQPAKRSYFQTVDVSLTDAPHGAEIVVIAAASTGPRPFARIGDRSTDRPITSEILKEIQL